MNKNKILIIGLNILLWGMFNQFVMAQIYSDTTWERLYFGPGVHEKTYTNKHQEYYDKGFLLSTYYHSDDMNKPKLVKTDINGYYLWDRVLDTTNHIGILAMASSIGGDTYISGSIMGETNYMPWVGKLNVCGEIEWCRTFEWDEVSYGIDIEMDKNGDIIILTQFYGHSPDERINLIKLTPDGELIWKKNYATIEDHPYIWNAQGNQLLISEDNQYYITGQAHWPTNNDPNQGGGLRSFIVKVNQWGEEKWVLPFGIEHEFYGYASRSYQVNDTLFLSVAYNFPGPVTPEFQTILIWYNKDGELLDFNTTPLLEGLFYDVALYDAIFLDDQTLWGIMYYRLNPDDDETEIGYLHIDTSMNVLNYYENGYWDPYGRTSLVQTHNDKFLTVGARQEDGSSSNYDVYISKRNEDYSFDTVYSNWAGSFDSLCPHQIESGYLPYNCETIIVGTVELESESKIENKDLEIKVSPNPANKKVRIEFENLSYEQLEMQIFNISGEEEYAETLLSYPQAKGLDISRLSRGVYMIVLRNKGIIVGRAKLVVE